MLSLIVNGEPHRLDGIDAFERLLGDLEKREDLELWASLDGQASLCALLNARSGWLMFLRFPEDAGFSSRNPACAAGDGETETFILGNGQADDFPRSWTFDRPTIFAAMSSFARSGERPTKVNWHDDSAA